jgi:hypothetical protein
MPEGIGVRKMKREDIVLLLQSCCIANNLITEMEGNAG